MMFLFNTIKAEVEPVPYTEGWFQLTGKRIMRESMDPSDLLNELRDEERLIPDAKLFGVHSFDEEIAIKDPRFNDPEEPGFGVVQESDGSYTMYLACNRAEYALFRFLVPLDGDKDSDDQYDPIRDYRR